MKSGLVLAGISLAAFCSFGERPTTVLSPDGRFALSLGAYSNRHWDSMASIWVTDSDEQPAAIVQLPSHTILVQLATPLRPGEDKVLWSQDSRWLAVNHRGNKESELAVYFKDGESFQKATIPDLPVPALQERPNKKPLAEQVEHFDFDKITPLRWVKSGVLLVSRAYGITNNTLQSISYSRVYHITIVFDSNHIGRVQNVIKEKQKIEVQE